MLSSADCLMEIRAQVEGGSGIGLKLFGFIPEPAFTFIAEYCSLSPQNSLRNHPENAFTFPRDSPVLLIGLAVNSVPTNS